MRAPNKRRIAALVTLSALVVALASVAWAWAKDRGQVRHHGAHALRELIGPPAPTPAPLELELDERPATVDMDAPRIPYAGPEAPPPPPSPRRPPDLEGVSFVLIMGADNRRPGVTGRTDTMIVAAFRHRDGAVAAFSIPRDLWVELPDVPGLREQGRTHARISAVLRVGEVRVAKGQGMALLRRTLDEQFGVRVDRYASVDLQGFVALVDELGGVEVEVECPLMDCFWLDGADQACTLVDIPAGAQTMDGPTALAYARSRHGTGDRERIRRQQAVLLGFARAARVRGLRGLPALWRRVEPHLRTDMSPDDALYYASFALEGGLEGIRGFSVSSAMTQRHVTEDGKHVMLLDRAAFDEALAGIFDAPLPALRERKRCPARDAALTYADRG